MARRWLTKRQPTTCGSSPWQQVDRPLGCRGVAPVWPIWFRCVMNGRTASPSPLESTSDLLPPSEAFAARRNPRIRLAASAVCAAPSACFLVQPAPATNNSLASGRNVRARSRQPLASQPSHGYRPQATCAPRSLRLDVRLNPGGQVPLVERPGGYRQHGLRSSGLSGLEATAVQRQEQTDG